MLQRPPRQFQRPPSASLLASAPLKLHNAPWGAVRTTLGTTDINETQNKNVYKTVNEKAEVILYACTW